MISISAVSLRSFTSFDDTLKNLRSGLDKGPIILYRCWDVLDYMEYHPDYKAKKGQKYVKETVCDSFKQIDILLTLAKRYQKAGDG